MKSENVTSISSYAPVLIPTLCRFKHFKSCLASLMACVGADKTDVFIGLDYPAKESHVKGWKQIDEWLQSIQNSHPFKSLTVIRRKHNYGFGPNGNFRSLCCHVLERYDRMICSEDDNIFSPAFLEFINSGLEKFKDDHSILAINGYRHFYAVEFEANNFFRQNIDFSAWGYGIWRDRIELTNVARQTKYWRHKALNPISWYRIYKNGWNRMLGFMGQIFKTTGLNDNGLSVYMAINNMDVVMPAISMVRNMGWDGTGEHCQDGIPGLAEAHTNQEIYSGASFKYIGSGKERYKKNHKIYVSQSYGRITFCQFIKRLCAKIINKGKINR